MTNGGRILSVTGTGDTVEEARAAAYGAVELVSFDGARFRTRHRGGGRVAEPIVGILVGSESDRERMQAALDELESRGITWELEVRSAHRTPDAVAEYAKRRQGAACGC